MLVDRVAARLNWACPPEPASRLFECAVISPCSIFDNQKSWHIGSGRHNKFRTESTWSYCGCARGPLDGIDVRAAINALLDLK
jgi:hypothetical protein